MVKNNGFFERKWQHHALVTAIQTPVIGVYLDHTLTAHVDLVDLTKNAISQTLENRTVMGAYEDLNWEQLRTLSQMVDYANQSHKVEFDINLKGDADYKKTF